jgi:hypothetical protein
MANKRISFDEEAPKISEPLVRVSDDFVAPYAEPVARPQDDPLVRMGQALSGLSSSLELYAKATEPERIEADKTAFREWEELTPEQQQAAVDEGAYKARQFEYIWKQEGANAAKEYERRVNIRFAEATDWNKPEQSSVILDEERAAILENLPDHLKNNALYLNQFDESSREFRERFKTKASTKAEERRVADGVRTAKTGLLESLGGFFEETEGVTANLEEPFAELVSSGMNEVFKNFRQTLTPGEQQDILDDVLATVADQFKRSGRLEDLVELKTLAENLGDTPIVGLSKVSQEAMAEIDKAIDVVERSQRGTNAKEQERIEARIDFSSVGTAAIADFNETGATVNRKYFQEKAAETLVGYSKEAVTEITNEAYNEYEDSVRRINSQKYTQTTRDRTEKRQEDGALVLASRNVAAEDPLVALNEWKRLENQVELSVYLEHLGYLEGEVQTSDEKGTALESLVTVKSASVAELYATLAQDRQSDRPEVQAAASVTEEDADKLVSLITKRVLDEWFTPYEDEEGNTVTKYSAEGQGALKAAFEAELEEAFAPFLGQYELRDIYREGETPAAVSPMDTATTTGERERGIFSQAEFDTAHGREWYSAQERLQEGGFSPENWQTYREAGVKFVGSQQQYASRYGAIPADREETKIRVPSTNALRREFITLGRNNRPVKVIGYRTDNFTKEFTVVSNGKEVPLTPTTEGVNNAVRRVFTPDKVEPADWWMAEQVAVTQANGLTVKHLTDTNVVVLPFGEGRIALTPAERRALTDPSRTLMLPPKTTQEEANAVLVAAKNEAKFKTWSDTDMGRFYLAYRKANEGQEGLMNPEQFVKTAIEYSVGAGFMKKGEQN